jgi:hypothetical protein
MATISKPFPNGTTCVTIWNSPTTPAKARSNVDASSFARRGTVLRVFDGMAGPVAWFNWRPRVIGKRRSDGCQHHYDAAALMAMELVSGVLHGK